MTADAVAVGEARCPSGRRRPPMRTEWPVRRCAGAAAVRVAGSTRELADHAMREVRLPVGRVTHEAEQDVFAGREVHRSGSSLHPSRARWCRRSASPGIGPSRRAIHCSEVGRATCPVPAGRAAASCGCAAAFSTRMVRRPALNCGRHVEGVVVQRHADVCRGLGRQRPRRGRLAGRRDGEQSRHPFAQMGDVVVAGRRSR